VSGYLAYGFRLGSRFHFPELLPACGPFDITLTHRARDAKKPRDLSSYRKVRDYFFKQTHGTVHLWWPEGISIGISNGKKIELSAKKGIDSSVLRLCLLGPGFSILLQQRGLLTLHASTVSIQGKAISFLGPSGAGKSTLAAGMSRYGFKFLSDNVTAIRFKRGVPYVIPSFPQIKLRDDIIAWIKERKDSFLPIEPRATKRSVVLKKAFSFKETPLARIYVLTKGAGLKIKPLSAQEFLIQLVSHSYASLWAGSPALSDHFLQSSRLARSVPASRLTRSASLRSFSGLVAWIKKDLKSRTRAKSPKPPTAKERP